MARNDPVAIGEPMCTASSASRTNGASRSGSAQMATVVMPIARHVRWIRRAISPRFAINTLRIGRVTSAWRSTGSPPTGSIERRSGTRDCHRSAAGRRFGLFHRRALLRARRRGRALRRRPRRAPRRGGGRHGAAQCAARCWNLSRDRGAAHHHGSRRRHSRAVCARPGSTFSVGPDVAVVPGPMSA